MRSHLRGRTDVRSLQFAAFDCGWFRGYSQEASGSSRCLDLCPECRGSTRIGLPALRSPSC